ncbi:P1 family peptidase [Rothia sp. AR01]|uniref:P1 family peptidase n=1 Tax=Rothia santali TaxID=2949643 RepID=A0A9X2HB16_9MICC|nr:P1 family peptidase [Rothia santali]MCP3424850.1 P1 family peptidase [Rothia santali]
MPQDSTDHASPGDPASPAVPVLPGAPASPGVRVGHWTDAEARTGCTVLTFPEGTVASCEVRGGAPASRELDLLSPEKTVSTLDAVLLTGGSAFGLAAADGVVRWCEERGRGVPTPAGRVPIVPALALFDLAAGDPRVRPDADAGYLAARATEGEQVLRGRIGAGTGAQVSQWRGPGGRRPGGLVYAERRLGELVVGSLCAVNAFGDVDDGTGPVSLDAAAALAAPSFAAPPDRTHTTIGVVMTNARLDKVGCRILAQGAHDGLARAITPPHTRFDGDGFVAAATGAVEAQVDAVRLLALAATADAIRSLAAAPPPGEA